MLKRFIFAFLAFVGLAVSATFVLAILFAPPASPQPIHIEKTATRCV